MAKSNKGLRDRLWSGLGSIMSIMHDILSLEAHRYSWQWQTVKACLIRKGKTWEREGGEEEVETYRQRPLGLENSHPDGCSLAAEPDINERPAEPDRYASTSYSYNVLHYILTEHCQSHSCAYSSRDMEEVRCWIVLYCRVLFEAQISIPARIKKINGQLGRARKRINQCIYVFEKCLSALSRSVKRWAYAINNPMVSKQCQSSNKVLFISIIGMGCTKYQ